MRKSRTLQWKSCEKWRNIVPILGLAGAIVFGSCGKDNDPIAQSPTDKPTEKPVNPSDLPHVTYYSITLFYTEAPGYVSMSFLTSNPNFHYDRVKKSADSTLVTKIVFKPDAALDWVSKNDYLPGLSSPLKKWFEIANGKAEAQGTFKATDVPGNRAYADWPRQYGFDVEFVDVGFDWADLVEKDPDVVNTSWWTDDLLK